MSRFRLRPRRAQSSDDAQLGIDLLRHTSRTSLMTNGLSTGLVVMVVWLLRGADLGARLWCWGAFTLAAIVVFQIGVRWCVRQVAIGPLTTRIQVIFAACFVASGLSWGGLGLMAMPSGDHGEQQSVVAGVAMMALAANLVFGAAATVPFALFHLLVFSMNTTGFLLAHNGSLAAVMTFASIASLPLQTQLAAHVVESGRLAHRNATLVEALQAEREETERANLRLTEANIELSRRATRDSLTGLANRELFAEHLSTTLTRARHTGRLVSVLYFDLDHFKRINDTYGHAAGDEVLRTVATRGTAALGPHLLARIGGDEFAAIVVTDTADEALALAEKVRACLDRPITSGSSELRVGISIGVGSDPGDLTPDELLALADAGLYRAKHSGRNQVQALATADDEIHAA